NRETTNGKGRRIALSLTALGETLLENAQDPTEHASAALMECFTESQQKQFIRLLKILTSSLEDKARAPLVMPEFMTDESIAEE
ncbi:MAG TPA: hypothetical protein VL424_19865, partial [Pararobbsia sp.]|nr:hypothetical protein [Pararobbsia sp.]